MALGIGYFAHKDASLLSMGVLGLDFDEVLHSCGHRLGGESSLCGVFSLREDLKNFVAVICAFGLVGDLAPE